MPIWELIILSCALATDAATVALCNTMCYSTMRKRYCLFIPFSFAFFQFLMPVIGFFLLRNINFGPYSKVLTFAIFLFLGGKMLYEGIFGSKDEQCKTKFTPAILITQSISTSIDAFAVGVSFAANEVEPFFASTVIGLVTLFICVMAIFLGYKVRNLISSKATIVGAILLLLLAIKALF